jgi:hypothetical protein
VPTPNINALLSAVLSLQDNLQPNAPVTPYNFGSIADGLTTVFYEAYCQVPPQPSNFTANLNVSPWSLIIVKNIHTANNLLIQYLSVGQTTLAQAIYGPGGLCVLFDPVGPGFSQLFVLGVAGLPALATVVVAG